MSNTYRIGWDIGQLIAKSITESGGLHLATWCQRHAAQIESGVLDGEDLKNFQEGFAAGVDQHVNGVKYARLEARRIAIDLQGMVPTPYEETYLDFWRRIQAERVLRVSSDDGTTTQLAIPEPKE